jgi:hypothetical protein
MPSRLNCILLWAEHRFPRSYQLVLPLGRALLLLKPPRSRRSYWTQRRHLKYYREVIRLAGKHVPEGRTLIDVGAGETGVVETLEGFQRRVVLDIQSIRPRRGVEVVTTDFMHYDTDTRFDLVLCLQVLEHLEDPGPFARKLFAIGRTVIISVPYRWPEDFWPWHLHDPVDEAKLENWTGRQPTEMCIVADEQQRMIAVYSDTGARNG